MKVCLVGSSGGHLTHLYMLKPFWQNKERFWVTFGKEDARSKLKGEKMYGCHYPTNRNLKNLIRSAIAFSDPQDGQDYFRRLYSSIYGEKPENLQLLQSQNFTVREIEILTKKSKSSVARELKGGLVE